MRSLSSAIFVAFTFATTAFSATSLYVSPAGSGSADYSSAQNAGSLAGLHTKVASLTGSMTSDIIVNMLGGRYELSSTWTLGSTDGGNSSGNVVYQAYASEKPIISGAKAVTGWSQVDATKNIWKATAPTSVLFRQMWVNDKRAIRARHPNLLRENDGGPYLRVTNWSNGNPSFYLSDASNIATWQNLNSVEMVVKRHWDMSCLRIASYTISGGTVLPTIMDPERGRQSGQTYPGTQQYNSFYFENAYELLDSPGEWYRNPTNNDLYYIPRTGENMASAEVYVPVLETVVQLNGAQRVKFIGLQIEHSTWLFPNSNGWVGWQGGNNGNGAIIPAAIQIGGSSNYITLEKNIVEHMGGSGLGTNSGSHHNVLKGNIIRDISGSGVHLNLNFSGTSYSDSVVHNYIYQIGRDYIGIGVIGSYFYSTIIEHNEIFYCPYSAISAGWGWSASNTSSHDNLIRFNNIHNVVQLYDDGAGVYTLSRQNGTTIFENYFHNITRSLWAQGSSVSAIYQDQGSSYMRIERNVVENTPEFIYQNNMQGDITNNTLLNNDIHDQSVKDNAGPQAPYKQTVFSGPAIAEVRNAWSGSVELLFDKPIDSASAMNKANYTINNSISVTGVTIDKAGYKVMLTTSAMTPATAYTVSVSNIKDVFGTTITAGTQAQFTCNTIRDGLVGWWRFDETSGTTAADSSGKGYNATVAGTWTTGKNGNGLELSGGTITLPCPVGSMDQAYSVSFWVYPHTQSVTVGPHWGTFLFQSGSDGSLACGMAIGQDGGVYRGMNSDPAFTTSNLGANTVVANAWQHFVITFNNGQAVIYKNGTLLDYMYQTAGSGFPNFAVTLDGIVDDMRVYNRALGAQEVPVAGANATACAPITFTPAPGIYKTGLNIAIVSATVGATIRYTTDGSDPSASVGTVYAAPVAISTTTTFKAIAYKSGLLSSDVATGSYMLSSVLPIAFNLSGNPSGGDKLPLTAWAGAVSQPNWNDLQAYDQNLTTVLDASGSAISGMSAQDHISSTMIQSREKDPNMLMMSSGISCRTNGDAFSVAGIPAAYTTATYDLYVYIRGAATYQLHNRSSGDAVTASIAVTSAPAFTGTFNDATTDFNGNYIVFKNLAYSALAIGTSVADAGELLLGAQIVPNGTGAVGLLPNIKSHLAERSIEMVKLFSLDGRMIASWDNKIVVPRTSLMVKPGVYIMKVTINNVCQTRKVSVVRNMRIFELTKSNDTF